MLCILGNIGICFFVWPSPIRVDPHSSFWLKFHWTGGAPPLLKYTLLPIGHTPWALAVFCFLIMPYTQKQDTRMQTWIVQQQFCMHGHVKQQSNESSDGSSANSTRGSIQCLQSPSSYSAQGSMMAAFTPRQPSVGTGGGHVNL